MELPATFTVHRFMEILFVWRKLLEVGTAAIKPIFACLFNFAGFGLLITSQQIAQKAGGLVSKKTAQAFFSRVCLSHRESPFTAFSFWNVEHLVFGATVAPANAMRVTGIAHTGGAVYSNKLTSPAPRRMICGVSSIRDTTLDGSPETGLPSMTASTCLP